jgi:hypothetical protein
MAHPTVNALFPMYLFDLTRLDICKPNRLKRYIMFYVSTSCTQLIASIIWKSEVVYHYHSKYLKGRLRNFGGAKCHGGNATKSTPQSNLLVNPSTPVVFGTNGVSSSIVV